MVVYMKRCCSKCIFHSSENGYGEMCNLYGSSMEKTIFMRYVSATDYDKDKCVAREHDRPCEYYKSVRKN